MIKKFKVRAPEGDIKPWLTPGKIYNAIGTNGQFFFDIKDDEGGCIRCSYRGSSHLKGKDWRVILPAVVVEV